MKKKTQKTNINFFFFFETEKKILCNGKKIKKNLKMLGRHIYLSLSQKKNNLTSIALMEMKKIEKNKKVVTTQTRIPKEYDFPPTIQIIETQKYKNMKN